MGSELGLGALTLELSKDLSRALSSVRAERHNDADRQPHGQEQDGPAPGHALLCGACAARQRFIT